MSLYSFAETSLTTAADRKRRPFVDKGQITRTLVLCTILLVALFARLHHG